MAGQTSGRSPGRIARSILAVLFGIIGVIGVLASVVGVWAHRTVFDSETVAEAVDQALLNPEVNEALATFLTDQVMDAVPLEDLVTERVPDELEPFIPVLVGGIRNVVHEGFTRVLEDGRAREALVAAVERAHEAVMRVLEGDGLSGGFSVEGEDIKVNLLPLLSRGLERLQDRGLLTSVDLPELARDGDPEEQIAELEDAHRPRPARRLRSAGGVQQRERGEEQGRRGARAGRLRAVPPVDHRPRPAHGRVARRQRRPGDQPAPRRDRPAPQRGGGARGGPCARAHGGGAGARASRPSPGAAPRSRSW